MEPFKIFESNKFCFCFCKQNWGANTCTFCTPGFADGPAVRTVRMRGTWQTQSLCQFQICQRRRRRWRRRQRRQVVAGDFDPTHYFSFTFRHCGGVRRRWRRQRCTLAKNHHLAKLSRLRHCQMRKEIDLPSGPWHRQPLRYTYFMVHAFKTESVNRYYFFRYSKFDSPSQVSVHYLNKLVQPILS